MRRWMFGVLLLLSGITGAVAQMPFNVLVVVENVNPPQQETYALVKLRPGDSTPVLQRALAGPATVTLSHDRRRIFAITPGAADGLRIEVFDADDFELQSAVDSLAPQHLAGAVSAELPTRPGVLVLARCWWIDSATGAVLESPQSLGLNCYPHPLTDGLSASGRFLLLQDDQRPGGVSRSLLVEVANPRLPVLELPFGVGPILDDDSAVVVHAPGEVELRSTTGAPSRRLALPEGWSSIRWLGAHRGMLYGIRYDGPYYRNDLVRIDTLTGESATVAADTAPGLDANADFNGRWALFTMPAQSICMILCFYGGASQALLDTDTGAVIETVWASDGPISRGRGLLAPVQAMPVDAMSSPLASLLLIACMLAMGWWNHARFGNAGVA